MKRRVLKNRNRRLRQVISLLLAFALVTGLFSAFETTVRAEEQLSQGARETQAEDLDQLLLPYYMSEQDSLPMQIGGVGVQWTSDNGSIDAATGKITAPASGITEVKLEASVTQADNTRKTKSFCVKVLPKGSGYVLSYTRENDDQMKRNGKAHGMYQSAATDSLHLGYSADGVSFEALHDNTGVLFAKNDGTKTKVLKQPYIFRMKDGSFGVVAVRAEEGESVNDQKGTVLLFTSKDLISYEQVSLISLSNEDDITDPACVYDKVTDTYYITWTSGDSGVSYVNRTSDFETVGAKEEFAPFRQEAADTYITYAIESNVIAVTPEEATGIVNKLRPVVNTTVDPAEIRTEPGKAVDLSGTKVTAHYSDGSTAEKSVTWNESELAKVDFTKEGAYEVSGTVRQMADRISEAGNYPFLAGRADPNVVQFKGKYYFIATTETGENNTNLYIREADTVAGLNEVEEHLVYDEAKGAEGGLVSTCRHWAPELHVINGELYMLFASNIGSGWDVQSLIMKLKTGGDPTKYDDWEAPKRYLDQDGKVLNTNYGGITLDMTHFSYLDRHYVVWSQRNFGKNGGTADLWIGETTADNPGQLISKPVLIVPCEYSWERNHQFVNEGPFVIMTENRLYLTYSGGATDETYCVGMTQIDLSNEVDFLNPDSWKKTNYPILTGLSSKGENKYHGPGHNSYVTDEDGNLVNVFHGRPGDGNAFQRDTFLRIVHFGADGSPILDLEEEFEILPENKAVKMIVTVQEKKAETPAPPAATNNPGASAVPGQTPSNSNADVTPSGDKVPGKGTRFESGGMRYKVTGKQTAEFQGMVKKNGSKLTIPATVSYLGYNFKVTSIAAKACYNAKALKHVVVGKNVTKIGAKAFQGCKKLKAVHIRSAVLKSIGNGAFKGIDKKAAVKVPAKKLKSYKKLLKGKGLSKAAKIKK